MKNDSQPSFETGLVFGFDVGTGSIGYATLTLERILSGERFVPPQPILRRNEFSILKKIKNDEAVAKAR